MEHNFHERKRENWLKRNSLKTNEDYICKLLEHFGIDSTNYNFGFDSSGEYSLYVSQKKHYQIQVDQDKMCYKLLEENLASNQTKKSRYHLIECFTGDELAEEVLRYIKDREDYSKGNRYGKDIPRDVAL